MRYRLRAAIELTVALLAVVGCVWGWLTASVVTDVAPVTEGEPPTTSVVYSAPLLALSLVCATVAGVLTVLAISRLRRGYPTHTR